MTILDKIMLHKQGEVQAARQNISLESLKASPGFLRKTLSLKESLTSRNSSGIIAEFKRKSPSKGWINEQADVSEITSGYVKAGAAGLSVLTDTNFFGANEHDFLCARQNNIPILRKDFIAEPYQVYETKAMGADVILLIAAVLTPAQVIELSGIAKQIGLEVLLELHDEREVDRICENVDLIGINNRDLKTFEVDIERALRLAASLPVSAIKIAESGINTAQEIYQFRNAGYKGFLMGESFMKTNDPSAACAELIQKIKG